MFTEQKIYVATKRSFEFQIIKLFKSSQRFIRREVLGILDKEGHYDIDGVSFDKSIGVIVASDASKFKLLVGA